MLSRARDKIAFTVFVALDERVKAGVFGDLW